MSKNSRKPSELTADDIAHYRAREDDITTKFAEQLTPLLVRRKDGAFPSDTQFLYQQRRVKGQFVREYRAELDPYLAAQRRDHFRTETAPALGMVALGIASVFLAPWVVSAVTAEWTGSDVTTVMRWAHEYGGTFFSIAAALLTIVSAVESAQSLLGSWEHHQTNEAWRKVRVAAQSRIRRRSTERLDASSPTTRSPEVTVNGVRASLQGLLDEWTDYKNDTTRYYLTHPTLHDTTGTIPPVVAYNQALADLVHAVDGLHDNSPTESVDAAHVLAETAWEQWHAAVDHAGKVGLDDRSTEERAALARLARLVHRLQNSPAADPELPSIKARIQTCLDKITTVSVSWSDIAALPGLDHAVRRELPAGVESS